MSCNKSTNSARVIFASGETITETTSPQDVLNGNANILVNPNKIKLEVNIFFINNKIIIQPRSTIILNKSGTP
ncbi:hypothetical protein BPO_2024 [Bergeyella porcorum]|uniref:DUF2807 domain-containing protein n=1 Tax=Bergeyella porcorum TaxID=1735111 RepID=A0AAU0F1P4_9FLAO